jgi:hypothetical protein
VALQLWPHLVWCRALSSLVTCGGFRGEWEKVSLESWVAEAESMTPNYNPPSAQAYAEVPTLPALLPRYWCKSRNTDMTG